MPSQSQRPTPQYERVADLLRARIEAGDYDADGRLGNEAELMVRYEVSRGTIRKAIEQLAGEGLVESRTSKGLFVIKDPLIARNSPSRLAVEQWGSGRAIWDVDLDGRALEISEVVIEQLPAPDDVAQSLQVDTGSLVWRRARLYSVGGRPVQHAVSYLPAGLVEGSPITQVNTGPGGVYARLAELGYGPVEFREELRSRMPTSAEQRLLRLSGKTPVLLIVRVAFDGAGLAVDRTEMVLDASRYVLGYDFKS